jgi:propanol-preferring alcohol dehydrogenase
MPKTMWAAVLAAPGTPLDVREVPIPAPGPGELLVKLEACGICHTDLHVLNAAALPDGAPEPLILGHEGIGRVVARGAGATRIPEGTRVGVPWLHDTCGSCRECLTGWESFCATHRAHGYNVNGGYAEYAVIKERFAAEVPPALDPADAAPLLCAGVTAYGGLRKAELEPGKTCVIIGCGGLGQYGIQLAKMAGAKVIAVDSSEGKLRRAKALGADHVFLAQDDAGAKIRDLGGADACVNFAPSAAVWDTIVKAINPRGWIISVAMVSQPVDLSLEWLTVSGARITGTSVGTRQELQDLLALASFRSLSIPIERVALRNVNDALDRLSRGEVEGRIVIDFTQQDIR